MIKNLKAFYKKRFTGQLFVIKAGGRIITDDKARKNLLENIKEFNSDGIKVLLIYGGGHAIDDQITYEKRKPLKIDGRRITSKDDIESVKKVLVGDLGFRLSETMATLGLKGYVFNTIPMNWADYKRRPKKKSVLRFDAVIEKIYPQIAKRFFDRSSLAICPCLGISNLGITVNINADNTAIALAAGMKAAKLILLTDVDGVQKNGKVHSVLTGSEVKDLIDDGTVTGGMQVKLENCVDALSAGVKRVHILNGFKKDVLRSEVYTSHGAGTMIVRKYEKRKYETELDPQKRKAS